MIAVILACGALAVVVTALVRGISDTYRGLVCWTFSAIASAAAAVVYFSQSGSFMPDLGSIITGLAGSGIIAVLVLLIELFAPSKRLRRKGGAEYDPRSTEAALNIVMIILTCAAVTAAACCERLSQVQFSVLGIIPAAAVSIRQLSCFMYRVKQDTLAADEASARRARLIKSLGAGKRSL